MYFLGRSGDPTFLFSQLFKTTIASKGSGINYCVLNKVLKDESGGGQPNHDAQGDKQPWSANVSH